MKEPHSSNEASAAVFRSPHRISRQIWALANDFCSRFAHDPKQVRMSEPVWLLVQAEEGIPREKQTRSDPCAKLFGLRVVVAPAGSADSWLLVSLSSDHAQSQVVVEP